MNLPPDAAPAVSIVVATSTAGPRLRAVLERVCGPPGPLPMEVLVCVPRSHADVAERVAALFPGTRVVPVDNAGVSIPALYGAGLRAARGQVVATTNDRFVPADGWRSAVCRLAGERGVVIAGTIEPPLRATALERAVYFMEYGAFAPRQSTTPARGAAAANACYSAEAVERVLAHARPLPWEYFWHEQLAANGVRFVRDAQLCVRMACRWTAGAAVRERYLYARGFAAERARPLGLAARWLRGAAAMALPPLMFARLCRRHLRDGWPAVSALPWIVVLLLPWALGELVGSCAGGGDSLARVTLG